MKHVLIASPDGARLYELSDEEFDRFEYLLDMEKPEERRGWATRFLGERTPERVFPPGARGADLEEVEIDRAIGGNYWTSKWGKVRDGRSQ